MTEPTPTRFPISLYSTTDPLFQDVFYTLPRAGHLVGGPDHRISRDHFPGHELILCLRGRGYVQLGGKRHEVSKGGFVWINCHRAHEHGSIAEDPWEVFWVRIEGPRLERISQMLEVETRPVFPAVDLEEGSAIFHRIFRLMQVAAPGNAPALHAEVARLVAFAFNARKSNSAQPAIPAPLQKALEQMRLFYFQPLTVAGLARHAGMSRSHFARQFKNAFGSSPIDWLRRERIGQAKRRLGDTTDPIQRIAELVGYRDRFFFSKDFKKLTGSTPREFRRREGLPKGI